MFRLILFFLKINLKITLVTLIIILSYTGIIIDIYINYGFIENMKNIYFNLNALLIIIIYIIVRKVLTTVKKKYNILKIYT